MVRRSERTPHGTMKTTMRRARDARDRHRHAVGGNQYLRYMGRVRRMSAATALIGQQVRTSVGAATDAVRPCVDHLLRRVATPELLYPPQVGDRRPARVERRCSGSLSLYSCSSKRWRSTREGAIVGRDDDRPDAAAPPKTPASPPPTPPASTAPGGSPRSRPRSWPGCPGTSGSCAAARPGSSSAGASPGRARPSRC